jgi:hypothetical protein
MYESKDGCMYLFHHDDKHEVHRIRCGHRISLTFDLVVDPTGDYEQPDFKKTVSALKKLGVQRFGFFATHSYIDEQLDEMKLKGFDHRLVEALKKHGTMTALNLVYDDEGRWFHPDVYNIIKLGPGFGTLMEELDDPDDYSDYEDKRSYRFPKPPQFPSHWEPSEDEDELFIPLKNEYKLGDVFVLHSDHNPVVTHMGNRCIHLGNEGFYGDIHENVFFLFEF